MIGRLVTLAAFVAAAAPAAAQDMTPTAADQQLRYTMQTFEAVLQKAVQHGAETFARQQKELPQGIELNSYPPGALGFAPPEGGGLIFLVVVPEIRASVNLFLAPGLRRGPQTMPATPQPAAQSATTAQGLVPADRMTASPATTDDGRCAARAKPSRGPSYEYAVSVCDALMDAMLDNAGPLPLKADEWLTIAAVDGAPASPLLNSPGGYTTYLQIRGLDLQLVRQGRITKEEARRLVVLRQR